MDNLDLNFHSVPLVKDDETVRITILLNICKMLMKRGFMDVKKYAHKDNPTKVDDEKLIDLFRKPQDSGVYRIPLDTEYHDEKRTKQTEFDGKEVIVRIVPQAITDFQTNIALMDFMKNYSKYHKIVVYNEVADKVFNSAEKRSNIEVFERHNLLIDLMDYSCSPHECIILKSEDIGHMVNPKIAKILRNDPMAKYYNTKSGDIMRIIRRSINNGREVAYRRVIDSKPLFK